jgi:2-iminobutanoate/2-iminopropanoate deaminase
MKESPSVETAGFGIVDTPTAAAPTGPYSQGIYAAGQLYVSGQLPLVDINADMPADPAEQAAQCLRNVASIVEAAGLGLDRIAQLTVLLTDIADLSVVNAVCEEFFTPPYPARMAFQVVALPRGAAVEISAVAVG